MAGQSAGATSRRPVNCTCDVGSGEAQHSSVKPGTIAANVPYGHLRTKLFLLQENRPKEQRACLHIRHVLAPDAVLTRGACILAP